VAQVEALLPKAGTTLKVTLATSGSLSADATVKAGTTLTLTGDLTVPAGKVLTIPAATSVLDGTGVIKAQGTTAGGTISSGGVDGIFTEAAGKAGSAINAILTGLSADVLAIRALNEATVAGSGLATAASFAKDSSGTIAAANLERSPNLNASTDLTGAGLTKTTGLGDIDTTGKVDSITLSVDSTKIQIAGNATGETVAVDATPITFEGITVTNSNLGVLLPSIKVFVAVVAGA
jgi:hypothetical protein